MLEWVTLISDNTVINSKITRLVPFETIFCYWLDFSFSRHYDILQPLLNGGVHTFQSTSQKCGNFCAIMNFYQLLATAMVKPTAVASSSAERCPSPHE